MVTTGRPTTYADGGMVASPHYLASQAGLAVLREGGNAIDAAIATNAVLTVVLPHQCHLGGDLMAMIWDPGSTELAGLNASGPAPQGSSLESISAQYGGTMPSRGALSVTVPGTVAGWVALHERYGSVDLGRLLADAVQYADEGFPVSQRLINAVEVNRTLLEQDEAAKRIFLDPNLRRAGDRLQQPDYANTLRALSNSGRDAFYTGFVAHDIIEALHSGGSAMSGEDLASFEPEWVDPLTVDYRGYELAELPANSQGPMALLLAGMSRNWDVAGLGSDAVELTHLGAEAVRIAIEQRDRFVGDPRFASAATDWFLDPDIATAHSNAIDPERASVGPIAAEDGDTVYFCVVDGDGMAVSMIQSVYLNFGSGIVTPNTGILLHCRGAGFTLEPDHPNTFAPGKRPKHTLIPAMLLKDGRPEIVFGAMGADGQAQTQLQLLQGFVDFGLHPQAAIEAPRWCVTADEQGWGTLRVESTFSPGKIEALQRMGHHVVVGEHWDQRMGHAQAIAIDRSRGVLGGGADPRGDGAALGF